MEEMFSPILGATTFPIKSNKEDYLLSQINDLQEEEEGDELYPIQPSRIKKKRYAY